MARRTGLPNRTPIRSNVVPPPGSVLTGELLLDGRPVYRRTKHRKVGVEPLKDAAGRPVYKRTMPGLPPEERQVAVLEPYDVEFVIDDAGNGMTFENYHFRPSAYEIEARQRRAHQERGLAEIGELATAAAEQGVSIRQLIASIRAAGDDPDAAVAVADEPPPEPPKPARKAPNGKRDDILAKAKGRLNK